MDTQIEVREIERAVCSINVCVDGSVYLCLKL